MGHWPVHDAKARFSELLDRVVAEGPQIVTKRGVETAVMVPIDIWRRWQDSTRPNLKELLLSPLGRGDIPVPARGRAKHRAVPDLA